LGKLLTVIANGAKTILLSQLEMLKEHIGEVGVAFFVDAFPPDTKEELEFQDWVTCWIRYLGGDENDDTENLQNVEVENMSIDMSMHGPGPQLHAPGPQPVPTITTTFEQQKKTKDDKQSESWFESNFLLKHLVNAYTVLRHTPIVPLLEDSEIARAYEPSYAATTGDIRKSLERSKVLEFLALLLIDFDHDLTERHVVEFMMMFCPDGAKGESVTWSDIERGLRERTNTGLDPHRLFMAGLGSPLNPGSPFVRFWRSCQQAAALFMFMHVPVRIAFVPYPTMTSWDHSMLALDLCIDCGVFLNLLANFNIAYMNKKSRWVTDREKIARHYLSKEFWIDLLCATPFDWFGFLSGASQRLSSCFRLPKMLFVVNVFKDSREGLLNSKHIGSQMLMIVHILMLLHCGTCVFFLLGNDGPKDGYTWYQYPYDESVEWTSSTYKYEYTGFGGFQDPDNATQYRVWKQYLLSFYWVTSTVTSTGIIGDMYPKNYNEVLFTMAALLVNLTLFSYVIGQVSANVLKGDEKLLKAREELGAVESYLNSFDFAEDLKLEIKRYFQGATASSFLSASEIFDTVSQSLRLEMSSNLTRKCLDSCTLFRGCSKQMKDSIKGLLREVHFGGEEYLVQINTVAHDMYFVMSGKVEQVNIDADGIESVEARIGPGGSVGILASYFGIRYMYSARASSLAGPCLCLRLVRNQLMPILKAYPDDEEVVAQNAMSEFQKVKQEKSVNGNSTKGRSIKSARSIQSERRVAHAIQTEGSVDDDMSDKTLATAYEDNSEDEEEQNIDAIILSGIEQKLASLNQRRKTERVAQFCSAASGGEIDKVRPVAVCCSVALVQCIVLSVS